LVEVDVEDEIVELVHGELVVVVGLVEERV
jgi:hypothetical protein